MHAAAATRAAIIKLGAPGPDSRTWGAAFEKIAKESETLAVLFKLLAALNYTACVLALTVNILFYRKPKKKDSPEETRKEKLKFRKHWIVMILWLLGTIIISAFDLNIFWLVPWMFIGAYVAAHFSGDANNPNQKGSPPVSIKSCVDSPREMLNVGKVITRPNTSRDNTITDVKPNQSYLPDLGKHLALAGTPQKQMMIYPSFTITEIAVVGIGCYCTTKVQEMNGVLYCGTFDFDDDVLGCIMARSSERTKDVVIGSLTQDPESVRQIRVPHPINIGIGAVLGSPQQGLDESFIPLVITEVF